MNSCSGPLLTRATAIGCRTSVRTSSARAANTFLSPGGTQKKKHLGYWGRQEKGRGNQGILWALCSQMRFTLSLPPAISRDVAPTVKWALTWNTQGNERGCRLLAWSQSSQWQIPLACFFWKLPHQLDVQTVVESRVLLASQWAGW